jgi:hypothetical protein
MLGEFSSGNRHSGTEQSVRSRPHCEQLEARIQPSASPLAAALLDAGAAANVTTVPANAFTPAQIRHAYGFDAVTLPGGITGDGSGQTVAIVDAYNDANIKADLDVFDKQFSTSLGSSTPTFYTTYGAASSFLTVVNQSGGTSLPQSDPSGNWQLEESLDVEWVHVVAPNAKILLVEASSASLSNLFAAVGYAAQHAAVVSMSWGSNEMKSEAGNDSVFSKYPNVTFFAASGDTAAVPIYPAVSPYVVGVGGTDLTLDSSSNYSSESAWADSGGGTSKYESQPSYQKGVITSTKRTSPDVAYDANVTQTTGLAVYDSVTYYPYYPFPFLSQSGWFQVGGTSAGSPQWAGLLTIADQGRTASQGNLGSTGTLAELYSLGSGSTYTNYFNDVTTGSAGANSAGTGYDLATGFGSPKANALINALVSASATASITTTQTSATSGGGSAGHKALVVVSQELAPAAVPLPVAALANSAAVHVAQPAAPVVPAAPVAVPVVTAAAPAPPLSAVDTRTDPAQFNGNDNSANMADPPSPPPVEKSAPAPATPAPAQEPSQSSSASPAVMPWSAAATGAADACFADESAMTLVAADGTGMIAMSTTQSGGTALRDSGVAALALAAMLGRTWMERRLEAEAEKRRQLPKLQ